MGRPHALFVAKRAVQADPAMQAGNRGARKLLVTDMYPSKEEEASTVEWFPPTTATKCAVQVSPDTEIAMFTNQATQDRHYHKLGTEIYTLLEGAMTIEVEGVDYHLTAGDMMVVNPYAIHEVRNGGEGFLCQVVTVNCMGAKDKYVVEK